MVLLRGGGESGGMAKVEAMIPDLDIYRTANVLVQHHGEDAQVKVTGRTYAIFR